MVLCIQRYNVNLTQLLAGRHTCNNKTRLFSCNITVITTSGFSIKSSCMKAQSSIVTSRSISRKALCLLMPRLSHGAGFIPLLVSTAGQDAVPSQSDNCRGALSGRVLPQLFSLYTPLQRRCQDSGCVSFSYRIIRADF